MTSVAPASIATALNVVCAALRPSRKSLSLNVVKTQSLTNDGTGFTHGDLDAHPGDNVYYKIVATNTGNTSLDVNATDVKCDGTLKDAVKNGNDVTFPVSIAAGDSATAGADAGAAAADRDGHGAPATSLHSTGRSGTAAAASASAQDGFSAKRKG